MARVTVEDCIDKVENRFDLVLLASHRARLISSGSQITIERDNDKNPVVALREIAETTISPDDLKEELVHSLQKYVEVDEPEPESVPLIGGEGVDVDDTEMLPDRMTEEELLRGLEGLTPPEQQPEPMEPDARATFRATIIAMTDSWLWELANQAMNRVPDPIDYIEMRRKTFGSDLTMSLARLSHGRTVPPEIYRTRPIRNLENSAADAACLINDIFSYQKEIQFEGEVHNCILVVQNFLDCDRDRALGITTDLYTARMKQFEHIVATELPGLSDDLGLDDAARKVLAGYVEGLQDWMAGILAWHQATTRYQEANLRPSPGSTAARLMSGPLGLGTAAARIGALFGSSPDRASNPAFTWRPLLHEGAS